MKWRYVYLSFPLILSCCACGCQNTGKTRAISITKKTEFLDASSLLAEARPSLTTKTLRKAHFSPTFGKGKKLKRKIRKTTTERAYPSTRQEAQPAPTRDQIGRLHAQLTQPSQLPKAAKSSCANKKPGQIHQRVSGRSCPKRFLKGSSPHWRPSLDDLRCAGLLTGAWLHLFLLFYSR
jgi:hypothetical protein